MLIAHLADLHLGRRSDSDPQGAKRLQALQSAIKQIAAREPEAILVAGDVFDSPHVEEAVVCQAARVLESARTTAGRPIPTVVISGNHDPADATRLWKIFQDALSPDSALTLVLSADCAEICDGRLLVEAYPCESRYSRQAPWAERVKLPSAAARLPHVVLAHGTLLGGPVPDGENDAYPFTLAEAEALGADYVALGHFHSVYPAWDGNPKAERTVSYAGTHEPDQFGLDSGWAILATLAKGSPPRLERIAVGRSRWELVETATSADLARLSALLKEVQQDANPDRFVIRLKIDRHAQLSPRDAAQLSRIEAELTILGAHVDRRGQFHVLRDPDSLDLAALPDGAMKQTLRSLREELAAEADPDRQEVITVALDLGYRAFEK